MTDGVLSQATLAGAARPTLAGWISGAILLCVLLVLWSNRIDGTPVEKDELQNLQMAENLWYHGTMSMEEAPPLLPSMQREPLPIASIALSIGIIDTLLGKGEPLAYREGDRAELLRYQNVLWFAFLSLAMFYVIHAATGSQWLALIGVGVCGILPFVPGIVFRVDQLDTEAMAATLLLLASYWLCIGIGSSRVGCTVAAGTAFGLLALVKAATLYVFAGMLGVLAVLTALSVTHHAFKIAWRNIAILAAVFAAVVVPWMARNEAHFGTFELANRSGGVLLTRAIKDGMTPTEYAGAFYVWAPSPLRPIVGALTGFRRADMMRGGRLQRLNREPRSDFAQDDLRAQLAGRPELAVSFYRQAQAELVKKRRELEAAGNPDPAQVAESIAKQRALELFRQRPMKHLATTVPFLWRGAFFSFPIIAAAIAYACLRRRIGLGLFVLPAFGSVMFYALLTHFIPRYGSTVLPVAIAAACMLYAYVTRTESRTRLAQSAGI